MSHRVRIPATLAAIVLVLGAVAFALAAQHSPRDSASPRLELSSKRLRITQSKAGKALISLRNAEPGQAANGRTRLKVVGERARVKVRAARLSDFPGPNGGELIAGNRLWISVRCLRHRCPRDRVAYKGSLRNMASRRLGTWHSRKGRTYRVHVWYLRSQRPSVDDNLFQGSRARFRLVWTATAR